MLINCDEVFVDEEFNSRGVIAPIDVSGLARSIEEHGLLQHIVVRKMSPEWEAVTKKKYNLVAGFRRFTAIFKVLKRLVIEATVHETMTDEEARVLNAVENVERKNLTIMQEVRVVISLKMYGLNRNGIADKLGKSTAWVQIREQIAAMPPLIQEAADKNELTQPDLRELYVLRDDPEQQLERAKKLRAKNLKQLTKEEEVDIIKSEKKTKNNIKRIRGPKEIEIMQDIIRELKGNCLETRLLGWCAGFVNDIEIHETLREVFPQHQIPEELINAQFTA